MALDWENALLSLGASTLGTVLVLVLHWLFVLRKAAPASSAARIVPKAKKSEQAFQKDDLQTSERRVLMRKGSKSSLNDVGDFIHNGETAAYQENTTILKAQELVVPRIVLFTDLGGKEKDHGDTVALFMLRGLEELGVATAEAVIVSGTGSSDRVSHVVTAVEKLRLGTKRTSEAYSFVGVGQGLEMPSEPTKDVTVLSATDVLHNVLVDPDTPDKSIVINCLCPSTDLAAFLKAHDDSILSRKLMSVTLLGSVEESNDARFAFSELFDDMLDDSSAFLKPCTHNPTTAADVQAAEYVYDRLQHLGVSLVVVGRHTVYQAAMPASAFEDWSRSNLELASQLRENMHASIEELWKKCLAPEGSAARGTLPARCNDAWFGNVFCNGVKPKGGESPWSSIVSFSLYDSVALTASVPSLRKRLFSEEDEYEYDCGTAVHAVFGQKELLGGVKRPESLKSFIHNAVMAGLSAHPEPYPMLIFTDPGQDLDDEVTLILLAHLAKLQYVRVIGVVACMHPAMARGELAKGMLKRLGMPECRVAAGSTGGCTDHNDKFRASAQSYMASPDEVETDWQAMCTDVLSKEENQSVVVLCISTLTDTCALMMEQEELFRQKVHSTTIMGGVEIGNDKETEERIAAHFASDAVSPAFRKQFEDMTRDAQNAGHPYHIVMPDTANNNTFDMESAINLHIKLQLLHMRLNVITRHAAYGCASTRPYASRTTAAQLAPFLHMRSAHTYTCSLFVLCAAAVPRSIYDAMHATGSPIAARLFTEQKTSIEELWKRCNASGAGRQGLPNRCDKAWFCKTFLKGQGLDRRGNESIWDLVEQFNMYDVLALVFAVPSLAWRFFSSVGGVYPHPYPTRNATAVLGAT